MLPGEIVDRLGLATDEEVSAVLANGERFVYGAVTLEEFALAADPVNRQLVAAPPSLL